MTGADKEAAEWLKQLFEQGDADGMHAANMHAALRSRPKALDTRLLVRYTCPNKRRCILLDVFTCPQHDGEVLFCRPPHKNSEARNVQTSNEAGRAKNTLDGNRHWPAQASQVKQLLGHGKNGMEASCDHVAMTARSDELAADIDQALETGETTRRTIMPT